MRGVGPLAVVAAATALIGCGEPGGNAVPAPARIGSMARGAAPRPDAGRKTLDRFAGRYRLEGTSMGDACGGRVVLAARHIEIDPRAGTLFADVVDRTYAANVRGERLVAEGNFAVQTPCGSELYERWQLTRSSRDTLEGQLLSRWWLPPRCDDVCNVRFRIRAVRLDSP